MAFLFWLGIRGARSAVVRPNAFLRRKSAAFSACNAENIRKCNRHGASEACGVSRLSFHFLFSKNECIFAVMRPDPDLTQTDEKAVDLLRFIWQNSTNIPFPNRFPNILTAAASCSRRFGLGSDRVADGVSNRVCRTLLHTRRRVDVGAEREPRTEMSQRFRQRPHVHAAFQR